MRSATGSIGKPRSIGVTSAIARSSANENEPNEITSARASGQGLGLRDDLYDAAVAFVFIRHRFQYHLHLLVRSDWKVSHQPLGKRRRLPQQLQLGARDGEPDSSGIAVELPPAA